MKEYDSFSELDLVALLKSGDISAFNEIYDRLSKSMYVYARKIIRDGDEAEDLVQEVFIALWNNAPTLDIQTSLSSYLYAAIRYKFLDWVARKKVRSDYIDRFQQLIDCGVCSTDNYINEKELASILDKEVADLPYKMREVFELSRNAGFSHREIAEKLDLSEKTVRNHINHALRILRFKLGITAWLLIFIPY